MWWVERPFPQGGERAGVQPPARGTLLVSLPASECFPAGNLPWIGLLASAGRGDGVNAALQPAEAPEGMCLPSRRSLLPALEGMLRARIQT